jgi:hypothetical protein
MYWLYDIRPNALLIFGLPLLETSLRPLSVEASQTLSRNFSLYGTHLPSFDSKELRNVLINFDPHIAVSGVDIENELQIFVATKLCYDTLPKEYLCGLRPLRGNAQCDIVASTTGWLEILTSISSILTLIGNEQGPVTKFIPIKPMKNYIVPFIIVVMSQYFLAEV